MRVASVKDAMESHEDFFHNIATDYCILQANSCTVVCIDL